MSEFDNLVREKIERAIDIVCPLYNNNLITDAYIIGSVAQGTLRKESDIDILIINPIFEAYLEELNPDEDLENIKKVIDKLKDLGVQFKLIKKEKAGGQLYFWYQLYKNELFHMMPQRYFINSLPHIQITMDLCSNK